MHITPQQVGALCTALAFIGATGCNSQLSAKGVPLVGKVVYKGTENPVPRLVGGFVCLESVSDSKNKPVGQIEDGGVFSLGTTLDGVSIGGVLPGEYRIRVVLPEDSALNRLARSQIDSRFTTFDKSGLRLTVMPGKNDEVKIEVEKPKR